MALDLVTHAGVVPAGESYERLTTDVTLMVPNPLPKSGADAFGVGLELSQREGRPVPNLGIGVGGECHDRGDSIWALSIAESATQALGRGEPNIAISVAD